MPLIPDGEAQDILDRLAALENIVQGMAKKADLKADLDEVETEVQGLRNSVGALQTRYQDLRARFEELSNRVSALE